LKGDSLGYAKVAPTGSRITFTSRCLVHWFAYKET